jgi:hypothetical protein
MVLKWRSMAWLLLTLAVMVKADGLSRHSWRGRLVLSAYEESLDGVVSSLRHRRAGRILSADTVREDGRTVHRIRILSDEGRVRGLQFDGNTGRPIPRRGYMHRRRRSR